jgi:hypothetical protein
MKDPNQINLAKLILPEGVSEYFSITNVIPSDETITIYLDEKDIHPEEFKADKLFSKGLFEPVTIQDFPLRGKSVFLNIRRRRWTNLTTGSIVMRDWNIVAKGTRMTKEFASFLKEISRYQAGKL